MLTTWAARKEHWDTCPIAGCPECFYDHPTLGRIDMRQRYDLLGELVKMETQMHELVAAVRAYQDLVTCHRLQRSPSEALWKRLDKAKEAMEGLE